MWKNVSEKIFWWKIFVCKMIGDFFVQTKFGTKQIWQQNLKKKKFGDKKDDEKKIGKN